MTLDIVAAFAYGIVTMIGGIIGYKQARSHVSLISGLICGLLLISAALIRLQGQVWGLNLAIIVTAVLLIFFTFKVIKTRKFMPAGLMTILGMLTLAVMIHQLVTLRS